MENEKTNMTPGEQAVKKFTSGLKKSGNTAATPAKNGASDYPQDAKTNEKIDAWIKANPDRFKYFNELPHDRAVRKLILNEIQRYERLQKMNHGIMQKLESDPEAKQAFDTLIKRVPEKDRERATAQLARHVFRLGKPENGYSKSQSTSRGMRVAA